VRNAFILESPVPMSSLRRIVYRVAVQCFVEVNAALQQIYLL
jgi:hypothetical protein